MDSELMAYVLANNPPPDPVEQELISRTESEFPTCGGMRISTAQASLVTLLVRLVKPAFALDVGTFTGSSALSIARGLLPGARLLCCEASAPAIAVARAAWERAGVADRIRVRLGPALETLRALPEQPCVDFAFIDADKREYIPYWDEIVTRTRPGGLVLVDNVFGFGGVADHHRVDREVLAVREFNQHVMTDQRVASVMVPLWDGLTLARRI